MPLDRGLIDQQLQALNETRWWDERELRDLPAVLDAGEAILAIARGKIARVRVLRRSWLIVVTDRRLLCIRSGSRGSWRQLEVSAAQIERVSLRVGLFRGRVLVAANGETYRLLVPRADAYKLEAALATLASPGRAPVHGFGPGRMVRRVMDHVLSLPAAALDPGGPPTQSTPPAPTRDNAAYDSRLQLLEDEVQELRRQVDFLEQLLRQRHPVSLAASRSDDEP